MIVYCSPVLSKHIWFRARSQPSDSMSDGNTERKTRNIEEGKWVVSKRTWYTKTVSQTILGFLRSIPMVLSALTPPFFKMAAPCTNANTRASEWPCVFGCSGHSPHCSSPFFVAALRGSAAIGHCRQTRKERRRQVGWLAGRPHDTTALDR